MNTTRYQVLEQDYECISTDEETHIVQGECVHVVFESV